MAKAQYFQNLNGLRFWAAMMVIFGHGEQFLNLLKAEDTHGYELGPIDTFGVVLFFCLSGFLITYLLLKEKETQQKVRIDLFYLRRILRIWPLYFLIVILAFFVLYQIPFFDIPGWTPDMQDGYYAKIGLFTIMMPNVAYSLYNFVPYAAHLWSIWVEEQFYIVVPVVIKYIKRLKLAFGVLMTAYLVLLYLTMTPNGLYGLSSAQAAFFRRFWINFNIHAILLGCAAAYIYTKNYQSILRILYLRSVQVITWVLAIVCFIWIDDYVLKLLILPVFFSIIILNLATNPKNLVKLNHPIVDYFGRISYGVYMYHPILISSYIKLFAFSAFFYNRLIMYPIVTAATLLVAHLSFKYFEKYFSDKRRKFSVVH